MGKKEEAAIELKHVSLEDAPSPAGTSAGDESTRHNRQALVEVCPLRCCKREK